MHPELIATFSAFLAVAIGVTRSIHRRDPARDPWARRLGATRLRRGDLPVGGTVAAVLALVALVAGAEQVAGWCAAAAAGMTLGAVGTGLADLLPPRE